MTPRETVVLTRYVKACCPAQAIDEYTPDAWHDILGSYTLAECRTAVVAVASRTAFVAPADIIAQVRSARAKAIDHLRCNELTAPVARRLRNPLEDARPLRETIRELIKAAWPNHPELAAASPTRQETQ